MMIMSSKNTPLTEEDFEKAYKFLNVMKKKLPGLKLDLLKKENRYSDTVEFSEVEETYEVYEGSNGRPFDAYVFSTYLLEGLKQLTEKEQRALILFYGQDLSLTEIAKRDHISPQAVSKTKQRALDKMRLIMEENRYE